MHSGGPVTDLSDYSDMHYNFNVFLGFEKVAIMSEFPKALLKGYGLDLFIFLIFWFFLTFYPAFVSCKSCCMLFLNNVHLLAVFFEFFFFFDLFHLFILPSISFFACIGFVFSR